MKLRLNQIVFVALMGSSALALVTQIMIKNNIGLLFANFLEVGVVLAFLYYFFIFIGKVFFAFKETADILKNPMKANLFPAISISAALISIMFSQIGLPFLPQYNFVFSLIFWWASLLLSVIFVVLIPINLKFKSKVEQVLGTWFIPPVGLFVLVAAGSNLALKFQYGQQEIALINLMILGPAFVLYFLTLSLVYFRSKFYSLEEHNIAPTFNIVLAPVGVSILAMLSTAKLIQITNLLNLGNFFVNIANIYSIIIFGYGLWVILGLLILYYRIITEKGKIPFSSFWWAFVFPLGAFVLATVNINIFLNIFAIKIFSYLLYYILLFLWIYIIFKQFILIKKYGQNR